ncbi:MAG: orotidine-5'-phosphate decarboxylase [Epulopiscium sp.]|nr:orotidine-5'-phosphate decarboxylase [Candidatus Epulonipiscium sp.]
MIDQLIQKIEEKQNPTVVGLDPDLSYIPAHIKEEAYGKYGKTPQGAAEAFYLFNKEIIDEVADLIPAVKPQIAMYEQWGAFGIDAYIRTIAYAKAKGLVIIGDIKRGDIASTAQAYSKGHIGRVTVEEENHQIYQSDFITVNPYMGYDSIEPYLQDCKNYQKGLFVLVKTSNPSGSQLQDLDLASGEKLYEKVGKLVSEWGEPFIGQFGYSSIGAVVGATYPQQGKKLREQLPHTFFLVPGYGAQGGTAQDLAGCFDKAGRGAIVNSSRGIIAAYKQPKYVNQFTLEEFAQASRAAVIHMKKDLEGVRS